MKPATSFAVSAIGLGVAAFFVTALTRRVTKPAPLPPLRWSDAHTWTGGRVPRAGDTVIIPEGRTVLLDVSPPPLQSITINAAGTVLRFDDSADRTLITGAITVSGATFAVGSATRPFAHRATIRLLGSTAEPPMFAVYGKDARLELHGEAGRTAWTRLAQTAPAQADTLIVADAHTQWRTGDRVVVAPTGYTATEAETRTVRDVRGATVRLDAPLTFRHFGEITARGIGEQAEVGLLSRNIVVEGRKNVGGCVMVMGAGAGAGLSNTEFRFLGVRGEKGKYPVHFHLLGNGTGSYVRGCAIHNAYNRWLTIHGTRHVVAENNVGFDTVGHGYFLEDGNETGNILSGNLGVLVRTPAPHQAVTPGDMRPAVFWLANPGNALVGNVAAGSDYYGFWYDLPPHPIGAATDSDILPRRTVLQRFDANTAHSCEHDGLFVDNAANPPGVYGAPTYDPREPAFFRNFIAYKCRRRGVWLRGSRLFLTGAKLADNGIGVTLAASASGIADSLIVGETANRTGFFKPDEPTCPLTGYEFYDGPLRVENTAFADFVPRPGRPASALGVLRFSPFFVAPLNAVQGLRFTNAVRFAWERRPVTGDPDLSGDGYRTAIFADTDGSVSGNPGARIVAGEPFLYRGTDACTLRRDWNAAVCDTEKARFARLFVDNRDAVPGEVGAVRLSPRSRPRDFVRMWGVPKDGANVSFQSNVRVNDSYIVRYEKNAPPATVRVTLRDAVRAGDTVTLTLPVANPKTPVVVYRLDANGRRTALLLGGAATRRERSGAITLRLTTPESGAKTSVEIVCRSPVQ